ncbi:hypothetical protein PSSHI_22560 [Photobacterium sp. R1]
MMCPEEVILFISCLLLFSDGLGSDMFEQQFNHNWIYHKIGNSHYDLSSAANVSLPGPSILSGITRQTNA